MIYLKYFFSLYIFNSMQDDSQFKSWFDILIIFNYSYICYGGTCDAIMLLIKLLWNASVDISTLHHSGPN